ncbi:MAG: hypothetical protein ABI648_07075 [Betaproteobacteria bacterium]|jgi:hypothetical protein
MNPRHSLLDVAWRLCAAAILCVSLAASAQSVHKEVDADGNITFTDRPESTPSPHPASEWDLTNALATYSPMNSPAAAKVDFNEAKRRLMRAQQGRPAQLPGENAGDSSVRIMNDHIRQSQRGQDRDIAAAKRRSAQTSIVKGALSRSDDAGVAPKTAQR